MLYGTYKHNMDEKGRVAVPQKFRLELGERFMVSRGIGGCVYIFSNEEWERLNDSIRTLPFSEARKLWRFFDGKAADVSPDAQGRICIPQVLRDFAGLSEKVVFMGTASRAELWDYETWQTQEENDTDDDVITLLDKINF